MSNLQFQDDLHKNITTAFEAARAGFTPLHKHLIQLKINNKQSTTMRAQPLINARFFTKSNRAFKIEIQTRPAFDPSFKMENLPENVLIGWFAHEMGHLMDYLNRPWYDLIKLGLAYAILPIYRIGVERRADLFAIEYGYAKYIQATKHFILKESNIPDYYRSRITKYYMTPEEIEEIVLQRKQIETKRDSVV